MVFKLSLKPDPLLPEANCHDPTWRCYSIHTVTFITNENSARLFISLLINVFFSTRTPSVSSTEKSKRAHCTPRDRNTMMHNSAFSVLEYEDLYNPFGTMDHVIEMRNLLEHTKMLSRDFALCSISLNQIATDMRENNCEPIVLNPIATSCLYRQQRFQRRMSWRNCETLRVD